MDMLTKGAFTVITATAITSVLILFVGNGAAKSETANLQGNLSKEVLSNIAQLNISSNSQHARPLPPPPGPFFKAQLEPGQTLHRDIDPKLRPKAPIILPREKETLAKALTLMQKKPVVPKLEGAPVSSFVPPTVLKEPVFNRGIKQPTSPVMPAVYSKLSNERKPESPIMPNFLGMQYNLLDANNVKFQNQYRYVPMPMMPNYQYQQYPTFGHSMDGNNK
ncbi:MAG: hypothetical protein V3U71_14345 [Cocleimonas sp.]